MNNMNSNAFVIILLILIAIAIAAVALVGAFALREYEEAKEQELQPTKIEILVADSTRLLQNSVDSWVTNHQDVVISSINVQSNVINNEVQYYAIIEYKAK